MSGRNNLLRAEMAPRREDCIRLSKVKNATAWSDRDYSPRGKAKPPVVAIKTLRLRTAWYFPSSATWHDLLLRESESTESMGNSQKIK